MSKVHFIADEAHELGSMECIHDAVGIARGYGIRFQFYFQSMGQVKLCFPEQEQVLLSNATKIFFGTNDKETADLVSGMIGKATVRVDSGGTNSGSSNTRSFGRDRSISKGSSSGTSSNWGQQSRELITPDELMALSPRTAITLVAGMRPIQTTLVRYYETNLCPGLFGRFWRDGLRLVKAAILCALALVIAAGLTKTIGTKARPPVPMSRGPHIFQE